MSKSGKHLFTSESVAEGHPDKICDQISDAILDNLISQDPQSRVACETYVTMALVIVGGEITTRGHADVHNITRTVIKNIGYTHPKYGLDYDTCAIINAIHSQSLDIAQGVDKGGAGDQGTMIGYACLETPEFMPLPIILAHKLVMRMAEVRKKGILKYLGPDGKSQVTVEYEDNKPRRIDSVVLACQHSEEILDETKKFITEDARQQIIDTIAHPVLKKWIDQDIKYYVNETGKFIIGGPQSDTGMTGRKVIVDTYGGMVPHGGGAFSGKDPTKVDRSATYMARYIAKNIVAAGLTERCLLQLAYVIGRPEPLSIMLDTFGGSKIPEDKLIAVVRKNFDLTPQGIIKTLDLLKPIYQKTACFGHFGRSEFPWEKIDKAHALKKDAGL